MQRRENAKEMMVGCMVLLGIVVMLIGLIGSFTFFAAGTFRATSTRDPNTGQINDVGDGRLVPNGFQVMFFGALLTGAGVLIGWREHRNRHRGPAVEYPRAVVVARFAYNRNFQLLSEWELEMEPHATFYVRLQIDPENVIEVETSRPVFYQCAEGMQGLAVLQGKWLGRFVPATGIGIYAQDDRTFSYRDEP